MKLPSRLATPVVLIAVGAIVVTGAGLADAATGGTFLLGKSNYANATTVLTNTHGTALRLRSPAGSAPLSVSNSVRVPKLNSSLLGGVSASQLQRRVTGTCSGGRAIVRITTTGTVHCSTAPTSGPPAAFGGGSTPPAAASPNGFVVLATAELTTTVTGSVLVIGMPSGFQIGSPPAGNPDLHLGLYVDGVPVPGSDRAFSAAGSSTTTFDTPVQGLLVGVAAGSHTVTLDVVSTQNGFSPVGGGSPTVSAVAGA